MRKRTVLSLTLILVVVGMAAYGLGRADQRRGVDRVSVPTVYAADANTFIGLEAGSWLPQERQGVSPTGTVEDRDVYYPGTEPLAPDEMRVIACGTRSALRLATQSLARRFGGRRHRRGAI